MNKLIIIGASGHGKVVANIAELNGYKDIVFLDNNPEKHECAGYPVIGSDQMASKLQGDLIVAVGKSGDRQRIMRQNKDRNFPVLIHPQAVIAKDVIIGEGTVIMAGTVINPGASIGRGCIVNTSSSIDHDCIIGDFCHVAVGAHLSGAVHVEDCSWIGAGAVVSNNISICSDVIVGAGAVVIRSIENKGIYIGVPAKELIRKDKKHSVQRERDNETINLLFTGVGRRIELLQAFRNAALVLNKRIRIIGADMAGTAPALAYCDYSRRVVSMKDPGYIDDILSICKEDKVDLVIPTIDTDLLVLSENKKKFEQIGTKVMISDLDKIRICRDKNNTSQFFVDCGLHAPMPVNDWRKYDSGYPAFIKPKDGSSSINAFKIENEEELQMYAGVVEDYIVQPFVQGHEYTIDIFCDWDGKPVSIVPRERIQIRSGEVYKTRIEMDQLMIQESKKLCAHFKPCGPMTVQLIRDEHGTDWFIEINPRFGGGTPLSMKAGARSAETILKLLSGEKVNRIDVVADGAIYSRFDQSVCITEGKSRIRGVIFALEGTLCSTSGSHTRLHDGVVEVLNSIKEHGLNVGIITDGAPIEQRKKLQASGLDTIDDFIVTDELGGQQFRKPCDIAFRIIQTRWRLNPSEIICVGNNPDIDFQAPRQLGMKCVWVDDEYEGMESSGRDDSIMRIESISSILDLIK